MLWFEDENDEESDDDEDQKQDNLAIPGLFLVFFSLKRYEKSKAIKL